MKKLFISCPMNGRKVENIIESMEKLHKIAEIITGEDLAVIDTFIEGQDYKGKPLMCLGESIKRMQDADYFITVNDTYDWNGCYLEREIARRYGVREIDLSTYSVMPDAVEVLRKRHEESDITSMPFLR